MKVAEIKFTLLDKAYWFAVGEHKLAIGDQVVVKTEIGLEIGTVVDFKEADENNLKREIKPILRKANLSDLEKKEQQAGHQAEALETCRQLAEKNGLNMKIIDVHFSFDGGRITFFFTAHGRVDFRDLVKDLTHAFQKSIRLHQIGVRDEAKREGEMGPCGRIICCKKFLTKLGDVNADCLEDQQIINRGSERLTGVCGRLKCCLRYEQEIYQDLNKNLPALGSSLKTEQGKGKVVAWHALKQSVSVALDDNPETIVELKI